MEAKLLLPRVTFYTFSVPRPYWATQWRTCRWTTWSWKWCLPSCSSCPALPTLSSSMAPRWLSCASSSPALCHKLYPLKVDSLNRCRIVIWGGGGGGGHLWDWETIPVVFETAFGESWLHSCIYLCKLTSLFMLGAGSGTPLSCL